MTMDKAKTAFRADRIFVRLNQPYFRGLDEVIAQTLDRLGVLVETDEYYRCLFPIPGLQTTQSNRLNTWLGAWHLMDTEPLGKRSADLANAIQDLSFVTEVIVGQDGFEAHLTAQKKFLPEDDPKGFR